jgi:3-hydroxyacyl-CoA dehydrogenase / enoyl-CoA hydratase / 3-hydroxybutyryl-CoA epimerase
MELSRDNFKEEVKNFRSSFKEDAIQKAEKSLVLEKKGSVGFLVFDAYQEKANKLSTPMMLRFFELLLEVEADKSIGAIVVLSRKPTIFIAGADLNEISTFATVDNAAESLMKLQAVFTYLEKLPLPSIAAIHGACMGGATELSLSCDYRMATDAPETKIGLPETQLGILPGWGGTQRMPRLLGLEKSLDLILTGRAVDGKSAKRMGLVDKLVPKEFLEEKAFAWALELAKSKEKRVIDRNLKERLLETVPGGKWLIFDQAKKKLLEKTKGNYPAPLKALEVIRETYGGDLQAGLKIEAKGFAELVKTPEAKNLISLFFLSDKVKRDKGTTAGAVAKEIKHAGVLGAGVMGGGIAQLFSAKGIRVRMKDVQWPALAKGFQHAYKIFKKQVDRRKMKPSDLDNAMDRIEGTTSFSGFKHLDLVIEAIVEDLNIKKAVFKELEGAVSKDTVLATNTSSLSVTAIGEGSAHPQRVVGMHFFNPVDKMPLVEVIRGKESTDEAVATVFQLAKRLGKTPIVVKDSPGFVVNRILGPYLNEAIYLLTEGVGVSEMDHIMEKFGMPMGPCALLDEVGIDVASKVSKVLYGAFGDRMKPPAVMDLITAEKRYGKKTGKGIYLYENGKKGSEDPTLLTKLGITKKSDAPGADIVEKRLVYLMINEAARCLEEGLVREVSDIDVGMIYGTGFAPFRGGLLRYADTVGPEAISSDLEIFVRNYGPRFQPCDYLQKLAVAGKKFYD